MTVMPVVSKKQPTPPPRGCCVAYPAWRMYDDRSPPPVLLSRPWSVLHSGGRDSDTGDRTDSRTWAKQIGGMFPADHPEGNRPDPPTKGLIAQMEGRTDASQHQL